MISDDIRLAQALFERISQYAELEALTQSLSIKTFRYVPTDLDSSDEKAARPIFPTRWSTENSRYVPAL